MTFLKIFLNNIAIIPNKNIFLIINLYTDKTWLVYSNLISLFFITIFILSLGMLFLNKAKHIKFLNLISAFYLIIYFYLNSLNYNYVFLNLNLTFNQNTSLFVNIFIFIATITIIFYFLSISDIFFLEENMKVEFSFLIWFIYLAAVFLISSTDFISIIILLECIAFSSYILVGFERKNKFSATSALKYLILASIPGGFFILGLSLLYNNFGSFSQDYLLLLLQTINTQNWYQTIFTDQNFKEIFFSIDSYYFPNNYIEIYTSFFERKQFMINYLNAIDTFTYIYDPSLVFKITRFESELIHNESLYTPCELYYKKKYYKKLLTQYLGVCKELIHLKKLWDHCFLTEGSFTNSNTYKVLFEDKRLDLLKWFSIMSLALFFENLAHFSGTSPVWFRNNIFGATQFQMANLEYIMDNLYFEPSCSSWGADMRRFHCMKGVLKELSDDFVENDFFLSSFLNSLNGNYLLNNREFWQLYFFENNYFFNLTYVQHNFYYFNASLIIYLSLLFILINLSFKLTAAPFHFWAPSIYGGSPLPTITFLSIFSKLTVIFLISWLFLNIFDNLKDIWQFLILCLALLSILSSILGAFVEKIFKRFFVYSSTGHVGFMLIGISVLNIDGLKGTFDYLILYIVSSFLIWFIIMHLSKKTSNLINLKGLSLNQTFLSFIFSIVIFSLSGIPPLGGFFVKYEIFYSLINTSFFFFAYFLLILTIISFFYYLRLIKIIFFENNTKLIKNKNLTDIKLRIIPFLFFLIPFFIVYVDNAFHYILKEILINSLY